MLQSTNEFIIRSKESVGSAGPFSKKYYMSIQIGNHKKKKENRLKFARNIAG